MPDVFEIHQYLLRSSKKSRKPKESNYAVSPDLIRFNNDVTRATRDHKRGKLKTLDHETHSTKWVTSTAIDGKTKPSAEEVIFLRFSGFLTEAESQSVQQAVLHIKAMQALLYSGDSVGVRGKFAELWIR